jgi:hypothetical protein
MSQRVARLAKSALARGCNVRLNRSSRSRDYNVFAPIFHTTAEVLCFARNLAKFFTMIFHVVLSFLTSFYGNGATKFSKKAERPLSLCSRGQGRARREIGESLSPRINSDRIFGVICGLLSARGFGAAIRRVATSVAVFAPTTPAAFVEGG